MQDNDYHLAMEAFTAYNHAIDNREWQKLRDAFAPDGVWITAIGVEVSGIDTIITTLMAMAQGRPYRDLHVLTNVHLEFDGDSAHSTSNWLYLMRNAAGAEWKFSSVGSYEDELSRIEGRWLLSSRRIINWDYTEPAGLPVG